MGWVACGFIHRRGTALIIKVHQPSDTSKSLTVCLAIKQLNYHLPTSDLAQYSATLEAHFLAHPPLSLTAAAATIEQLTGIKRSHTQVGVFLRKLGLRRVKSYAVPAKGNPQVQAEIKKKNSNHVWHKLVPEHVPSSL